jgi:hypothetical protein
MFQRALSDDGLDLSRNMLWYTCLIKHAETLLRTKDCWTLILIFGNSHPCFCLRLTFFQLIDWANEACFTSQSNRRIETGSLLRSVTRWCEHMTRLISNALENGVTSFENWPVLCSSAQLFLRDFWHVLTWHVSKEAVIQRFTVFICFCKPSSWIRRESDVGLRKFSSAVGDGLCNVTARVPSSHFGSTHSLPTTCFLMRLW